MRELFTRDSQVWWLGIAGAVITYLIGAGKPPTEWSYGDWLQALAFLIATVSALNRTSPQPHSVYGKAKITPQDFQR